MKQTAQSKALHAKAAKDKVYERAALKAGWGPAKRNRVPSKYKGNTNSEGGIPFGKPPKGER